MPDEQNIDLAPQEDLDEELEEARETPEATENRKSRRRNRIKEFEERTKRAEEQNRVISEQMAQMTATLGKIVESQMAKEKDKEPEEDPIAKLEQEQEKNLAMYGAIPQPTPEQARAFLDRDREYNRQLRELTAEKVAQKVLSQQQNKGSTLVDLVKEANPDVFSNQKAHRYVGALYQVALEGGDTVGPNELNEMVEAARKKFNIAPKPTSADRTRFSSHGSMVGGAPTQNTGMQFDLTDPAIKKMIRAYGNRAGISDEVKQIEHWVKNVGRKLGTKK